MSQKPLPVQPLKFRAPSTLSGHAPTSQFTPPSLDFLAGAWHVTHSTLPMWKDNRNVVITYTPVAAHTGGIDDLVEYQPLNSDKQKTVRGFDAPDAVTPGKYQWRGKGLLKIASSEWEVLGYGNEEGGWAVTYFQKTLFTPAGIDIYARQKGGLTKDLLEQIVAEMKKMPDTSFQKMVEGVFVVKHD